MHHSHTKCSEFVAIPGIWLFVVKFVHIAQQNVILSTVLSCCSLSYPHPYQCELDNYVPDEKFLEKAQLQVCQRGHRMSVTYVDDIYFAPVGERSIAISLSVCLCVCLSIYVCVCLSMSISLELLDRSSRHFCADPPGCGSVLLWRRYDTLCTSCFMNDVTFGRSGPYGGAWKAEPLAYYHRCTSAINVVIPGQSLMSMSALL